MVKAQNVINDLVPILNGGGADLPAALPADQLFTTQFIDKQIR